MKCLKAIFFFSFIAVACVSAGKIYGQSKAGTEKLVERETRLTEETTVKFNNNGKYDLTIDKVDLQFYSGGVSCKIISGGPFESSMSIQMTPLSKNVRTTAIIYGRMKSGKKSDISPLDITFE